MSRLTKNQLKVYKSLPQETIEDALSVTWCEKRTNPTVQLLFPNYYLITVRGYYWIIFKDRWDKLFKN